MSVSDRGISGDRDFPATSWSFLLRAQDPTSADYARQMARLAEIYWRPVYSFIRQAWGKGHDDAKDFTQEFFATVMFERHLIQGVQRQEGGFRAFLRTAIARFMVDAQRGAERKKRGGGAAVLSLEALGEVTFEPVHDGTVRSADEMFDVAWNEAVMSEAMARLRQRLGSEGQAAAFDVFKRYDFDGDSAEMSYAELGRAMAMTDRQVKHALTQARGAFRQIVTEIVSGYVDDPTELTAELKALFGV